LAGDGLYGHAEGISWPVADGAGGTEDDPQRKARLLEQMELQLEELEADASQDELAAELAARSSTVRAFERKRPSRKPFPEDLPRERVVIAPRPCCGSAKLAKLGEDITETLEVIPRPWKVIQVRETHAGNARRSPSRRHPSM
jgi:hypothetical protein